MAFIQMESSECGREDIIQKKLPYPARAETVRELFFLYVVFIMMWKTRDVEQISVDADESVNWTNMSFPLALASGVLARSLTYLHTHSFTHSIERSRYEKEEEEEEKTEANKSVSVKFIDGQITVGNNA